MQDSKDYSYLKRLSKFKFGNNSKPNTANKRREEELKLDLGGF